MDITLEKLLAVGGAFWNKNGLRRVYFNNLYGFRGVRPPRRSRARTKHSSKGSLVQENPAVEQENLVTLMLCETRLWFDLRTNKWKFKVNADDGMFEMLSEQASRIIPEIVADLERKMQAVQAATQFVSGKKKHHHVPVLLSGDKHKELVALCEEHRAEVYIYRQALKQLVARASASGDGPDGVISASLVRDIAAKALRLNAQDDTPRKYEIEQEFPAPILPEAQRRTLGPSRATSPASPARHPRRLTFQKAAVFPSSNVVSS